MEKVLALRSAPPIFGPVQADRISGDVYGLRVAARVLPGERDCNHYLRAADGREYVLKIMRDPDATATDCQVRVLQHLAAAEPRVPVPIVQFTTAGLGSGMVEREGVRYATLLLSYLPGNSLSASAIDAEKWRATGRALAGLDLALQGFFHAGLERPLAWDPRRLPELIDFARYIESDALRRRLVQVARDMSAALAPLARLRSQAIHGDGHGGNLLQVDGAIAGILDFGDMIHAPVVMEVAIAIADFQMDTACAPEELVPLLAGYAEALPLGAADLDLLFDLVTARQATTVLIHMWRSRHDPEGARLLQRAAANASPALETLALVGRVSMTERWSQAAGLLRERDVPALARRQRLLGDGAELFYEQPLHIVRGEGVWLYDSRGLRYLDGYNNVAHVGHAHPTVVRAIQSQTALLSTHTRYLHGRILDYAERLTARCPAHLNACIFVNSGSEANDVAWRLAQFATGRDGAFVMAHAYHGITAAVAALTPGAGEPQDPRVAAIAAPAGDSDSAVMNAAELDAVRTQFDTALERLAARGVAPAAFFIDTALTSSGILDPPPLWGETIVRAVRDAGGLVVADEVQYGLGRSGSHFWGFERRGVSPDIITLGKPLGNGYPIGAVIANRELIEAFQAKHGFFSTFGGNPVAAAAGIAVLDVIEREQLVANARDIGRHLLQTLGAVAARHVCLGRVRGSGLLVGLEVLGYDAVQARLRAKVIINALARRARVLIGYEGPQANILKLRPPLPFQRMHVDLVVQAIDAAATEIDAQAA